MCHQTVSLIARALEGNGLPTMILGSAFDILQSGWAPRATFLDYPLGHSAGMPFDRADQLRVTRSALLNLEALREPGLIVQLPSRWAGDAVGQLARECGRPLHASQPWTIPTAARAVRHAWRGKGRPDRWSVCQSTAHLPGECRRAIVQLGP